MKGCNYLDFQNRSVSLDIVLVILIFFCVTRVSSLNYVSWPRKRRRCRFHRSLGWFKASSIGERDRGKGCWYRVFTESGPRDRMGFEPELHLLPCANCDAREGERGEGGEW